MSSTERRVEQEVPEELDLDWEGEQEEEGMEYLAGAGIDLDEEEQSQQASAESGQQSQELPELVKKIVDVLRSRYGAVSRDGFDTVTVQAGLDGSYRIFIDIPTNTTRTVKARVTVRYSSDRIVMLVEDQEVLSATLDKVKIRLVRDDKYDTAVGSVITRNGYIEVNVYTREILLCIKDSRIVLFDTCRTWD